MEEGFVFDIEGDGLYLQCQKIWFINFKSIDGIRELSVYPFRENKEETAAKIKEWIHSFPDNCIVGSFNGLSYDHFVLWKLLGIAPVVGKRGKDYLDGKPVQFCDVFYMAQFLDPNLPSHSLANLSKGSVAEKIDYRESLIQAGKMKGDEPKGFEFSFYDDLMVEYCQADVAATIHLLKKQINEMKGLYKGEWNTPAYRLGQKSFFLMKAQEHTGCGFDLELAKKVQGQLAKDMAEVEANVLPKLPLRGLKKTEEAFYKMPSKPWTKSGEPSAALTKFLEKHSATLDDEGFVHAYGLKQKLVANDILEVKLPMLIGDQQDFKDWLLTEHNWQPTFWNLKRGPDGKPERDAQGKVIETSPKLQEAGVICPHLLTLEGEVVREVVKFLSLRNRASVLAGWISNWRLDFDGRIGASSTKIATSHRQCHSTICNVPRAGGQSLYGDEFRSLFCAQDGNVIAAADASGLEQRCAGHATYKYDDGEYANELLNGDVHSKVAIALFPQETRGFDHLAPDFNKDDPKFKPWRSKAKSVGYAVLFGAAPPKLAKMLNKSESEGKRVHKAYWDANPSMAKFIENLTKWWDSVGKKSVIPAVDGRLLKTRSKHSLGNNYIQSLGAILMDTACCIMDAMLGEMYIDEIGRPYYLHKGKVVKRTIYYHKHHCGL